MNLLPYLIVTVVIWIVIAVIAASLAYNAYHDDKSELNSLFMVIFLLFIVGLIIILALYGISYFIQGGNESTLKYEREMIGPNNYTGNRVVRYGFQTYTTNGEVVHSDSNLIVMNDGSIFGTGHQLSNGIKLCKEIGIKPIKYTSVDSTYIKSITEEMIKNCE